VSTWGATVPMGHTRVFAKGMSFECALLGRDAVNVHGAVAALSCNIFVEGVPGHTLYIVSVLGDLVHAFPYVQTEMLCF
jgi:hypothetical protein